MNASRWPSAALVSRPTYLEDQLLVSSLNSAQPQHSQEELPMTCTSVERPPPSTLITLIKSAGSFEDTIQRLREGKSRGIDWKAMNGEGEALEGLDTLLKKACDVAELRLRHVIDYMDLIVSFTGTCDRRIRQRVRKLSLRTFDLDGLYERIEAAPHLTPTVVLINEVSVLLGVARIAWARLGLDTTSQMRLLIDHLCDAYDRAINRVLFDKHPKAEQTLEALKTVLEKLEIDQKKLRSPSTRLKDAQRN